MKAEQHILDAIGNAGPEAVADYLSTAVSRIGELGPSHGPEVIARIRKAFDLDGHCHAGACILKGAT